MSTINVVRVSRTLAFGWTFSAACRHSIAILPCWTGGADNSFDTLVPDRTGEARRCPGR